MARYVEHTDGKTHKVKSRFVEHTDGKTHKVVSRWVVDTDGTIKKIFGGMAFDFIIDRYIRTASTRIAINSFDDEIELINADTSSNANIALNVEHIIPLGTSATIEFDYIADARNFSFGASNNIAISSSLTASTTGGYLHGKFTANHSSGNNFYMIFRLPSAGSGMRYLYVKNLTINGKSVGFDIHYTNL